MSRPIKIGLDYFPVDTSWDMKMRLLKAKYKLEGVGLIIELFQAIYHEGYALEWNEDSRILVSDEAGITAERLDEIVGFAASKGIFDQSILDKGFLTSHGIQSRWMKACSDSKRKERFISQEIDLLHYENEFTPEETQSYPEETKVNSEFSTQKKRKENKLNKNKKEIINEFSQDFLTFYDSYPRKEGKTQANKTFSAVTKKGVSLEKIMAALAVYKAQIERKHTEPQYIKLPATFLNCLDDFAPEEPTPTPRRTRLVFRAGQICTFCQTPLPQGRELCPHCNADLSVGMERDKYEEVEV